MKLTTINNLKLQTMQVNNNTEETKKPYAVQLLEGGLSDLKQQLTKGDTKEIADLAGKSERTVIRYVIDGDVADVDTGSHILAVGRAFILEREKRIKKLVA